MRLTDAFWIEYELDLQEVKLSYLNWAIGYATEPRQEFWHLFLWDHQREFCIVNSRYGRAFAISPFGSGVRGVPRQRCEGMRGAQGVFPRCLHFLKKGIIISSIPPSFGYPKTDRLKLSR
jgi:hypothetical protein